MKNNNRSTLKMRNRVKVNLIIKDRKVDRLKVIYLSLIPDNISGLKGVKIDTYFSKKMLKIALETGLLKIDTLKNTIDDLMRCLNPVIKMLKRMEKEAE